MLHTIAIHGYRSLRDVCLPLGGLTVVTGANGTGKSSLYAALKLLGQTASGTLVSSLAHSGGLESVLWAGPEHITGRMVRGEVAVQGTSKRVRPVSLMLGFTTDDLGYLIDLGLPALGGLSAHTMFTKDPIIKRELVWGGPVMRPASMLVRRANHRVDTRTRTWTNLTEDLGERDSILGELSDPERTPELLSLRRTVRSWRFHDSFRTDRDAPARQPQVATWTPVMADDASDFVPALQTVLESAFAPVFVKAVASAFPGGQVDVVLDGMRAELRFQQAGLLRPLSAAELSDGTLRYLLLATALCSPRPPGLLVLNEPETSLHPDVLPGLADLIADTAQRTQVVVVSHSTAIVERLRLAFTASTAPPGTELHHPALHHTGLHHTALHHTGLRDEPTPLFDDSDTLFGAADEPFSPGGEPDADEEYDPYEPDADPDDIVPGEGFVHHHLVKQLGETLIDGQGMLTRPTWDWGRR